MRPRSLFTTALLTLVFGLGSCGPSEPEVLLFEFGDTRRPSRWGDWSDQKYHYPDLKKGCLRFIGNAYYRLPAGVNAEMRQRCYRQERGGVVLCTSVDIPDSAWQALGYVPAPDAELIVADWESCASEIYDQPLPGPPPRDLRPPEAASGPPPSAEEGKQVVELRTSPPGYSVWLGEVELGQTPMFITVSAEPGPPCNGGTCVGVSCSGGSCMGGSCVGGSCANGMAMGGVCSGETCVGATCTGGTCEGAVCPEGFRCAGSMCSGGTCDNATCSGGSCTGTCSGAMNTPSGGTCSGGTCSGSCTGAVCSGGVCEPVTEVTLRREGAVKHTIELGPSSGPVLELLLQD